jgi:hypothetical protein
MTDQPDSESVIAFGPPTKSEASKEADKLDAAGQTILKLLNKAAGVAEANSKHVLEMAHKVSHQLRAAENRIGELEAKVKLYREKSERAEQWLHKIFVEIEERLVRQPEEERRRISRP